MRKGQFAKTNTFYAFTSSEGVYQNTPKGKPNSDPRSSVITNNLKEP